MTQNSTEYMLEPDAIAVLESYGIEYPPRRFATDSEAASVAADSVGFPAVMKIVSPDVIHKSDAGGVVVGIESGEEAARAFDRITAAARAYDSGADVKGALLCRQADEADEVIIGTVVDEIFGPTVMFGLGGIFVEILEDVTFRVCPIDTEEALEMVQEIKGYDILAGARGRVALDIRGLAELISNVSRLAVEHDEIREIDLNPVRVYENGVLVLDARIIRQKDGC